MNKRVGDGGSLTESVFETALGSMNGHGKVGWNQQDYPVGSKPSRVEPRE
ncbi:hypothetical protein [Paenibacillus xylanexedens]|nr:hypothetical protein [Paenibacillus xylanexedens]